MKHGHTGGYLTVTDYRGNFIKELYISKLILIFQCTGYLNKFYLSEAVIKCRIYKISL